MTVLLTGTGGWGTRMGHFIHNYNQADLYRGPELDALVSAIFGEYLSNDQIVIDNLFRDRDAYRGVHTSWLGTVQRMASNTTIEQVNRDAPLPQKAINPALVYLIDQLKTGNKTVVAATVGSTVTPGPANSGTAELKVSTADPYDGSSLDYAFNEVFDVVVTSDAASGGTAFSEQAQAAGDPSRSTLEYNWPGGSGTTNVSIGAIDGERATLVNGAFESWTGAAGPGGVPAGWTPKAGNSTIEQSTAGPFRGSSNLKITTVAGTPTRLRAGPLSLSARTAYRVGIWVKRDTTTAAQAGSLAVSLVEQDDTVINGEGTPTFPNTLAINTAGLTTSYVLHSYFFRTPRVMPLTVYLDLYLATVPATPMIIHVDTLSFGLAQQLYQGGPFIALFSSDTALARGDRWTVAITNSYTSASFNRGLDRMFDLRRNGLKFLSGPSGSAALPDSLVM